MSQSLSPRGELADSMRQVWLPGMTCADESSVFAQEMSGVTAKTHAKVLSHLWPPPSFPFLRVQHLRQSRLAVYEGSSTARLALKANAGLSRGRLHHIDDTTPSGMHTSLLPSRSASR